MPSYVTSRDGTRIAYDSRGNGPSLVIVLGALNTRKSGAALAKLLSNRFTAVSYDRRGRGNSSDSSSYSPAREVEDLGTVIDALGEPACLYGHSSGGALAAQVAVEAPKRVRKLAVYEVPYAMSPEGRAAAGEYFAQVTKLISADRRADAVGLFVKSVGVSDKQLKALQRMPMWKGLERIAPTLAYDSQVMGKGHALPASLLARVATPTLVMHGEKGAPFIREAAIRISQTIPGARLETLAGQSHGVAPKAVAPRLEAFFR